MERSRGRSGVTAVGRRQDGGARYISERKLSQLRRCNAAQFSAERPGRVSVDAPASRPDGCVFAADMRCRSVRSAQHIACSVEATTPEVWMHFVSPGAGADGLSLSIKAWQSLALS